MPYGMIRYLPWFAGDYAAAAAGAAIMHTHTSILPYTHTHIHTHIHTAKAHASQYVCTCNPRPPYYPYARRRNLAAATLCGMCFVTTLDRCILFFFSSFLLLPLSLLYSFSSSSSFPFSFASPLLPPPSSCVAASSLRTPRVVLPRALILAKQNLCFPWT